MGDLNDGQERITLALYGGALAAVGVLLVAFLFYMQTALPLLRDLRSTLSNPPAEEIVATDAAGNTITIPAITAPASETRSASVHPATQIRLVTLATTLGSALVGWSLAASPWRGIAAALAVHVALLVATFVLNDALVDPLWFLGCLLLAPALTIIAALLIEVPPPGTQRLLPAALIASCTPPIILLSLRIGWWLVPITWVVLPIIAAIVSAKRDMLSSEQAV